MDMNYSIPISNHLAPLLFIRRCKAETRDAPPLLKPTSHRYNPEVLLFHVAHWRWAGH